MLRKTLLKAFVLVYNQGQPEEGVYTLFVQVGGFLHVDASVSV